MRTDNYRRTAFSLIFCSLFWLAASSSPSINNPTLYRGMTLEEALRRLQLEGLNILYSSDLVHDHMFVQREPSSSSPQQILNELLSPHGLKIERGPENTLLVVLENGDGSITSSSTGKRDSEQYEEYMENVTVPFVTVYLTAQNGNNQFVTNLTAQDFVVLEDGKEQPIVDFVNFAESEKQRTGIPLTVLFLIDNSQSMNWTWAGTRRYETIRDAALEMLNEFGSEDQIMVMGFNETSWIISEATGDTDAIRRKLMEREFLRGKTAIFDALNDAATRLKRLSGRKLIVLFSDGEDNTSRTSLDRVLRALQSSDITVLTFGTSFENRLSQEGREALQKISDVSGGYSFITSASSDMSSLMQKIGSILRSQYAAGYAPPNPTIRKWRHVRVYCKVPGVRLHYRSTYLF